MRPRVASTNEHALVERVSADLRKIRMGITALGLGDDDRRDLMQRLAGVRSSKALDAKGRTAVLAHLQAAGAFKDHQRGASYAEGHPRMARGLWIKLKQAGLIANGSDRALDMFVSKQTGRRISSARFLTDPAEGQRVVEALKAMLARGVKA